MATTYNASFPAGERQSSGEGFFRRVLDRVIEARQKEANRQILCYLNTMDNDTLRRFGFTNAQIVEITGKPKH